MRHTHGIVVAFGRHHVEQRAAPQLLPLLQSRRAHAIAVAQSDALPVMYNKFSLESLFTTVKSRSERVETGETGGKFDPNKKVDVTQTSSFKDQTSAVNEPGSTIEPSANKIKTFGRIGDLTNRVLGIASSKFNFHRPTVVMTLKHLVDNFDELTGLQSAVVADLEAQRLTVLRRERLARVVLRRDFDDPIVMAAHGMNS